MELIRGNRRVVVCKHRRDQAFTSRLAVPSAVNLKAVTGC